MPSFLTPDFGLLFWMLLAFLVVLFVLAKFGFPAIIHMVEERKKYIDDSLASAREANEKLANIKSESEAILKEAQSRQSQILKDATAIREKIIREAKEKAQVEANRILEDARTQISAEQDKAMRENRERVADLSIQIAGKVLSKNLEKDEEQQAWINRLLDEMSVSK
jgi:F-type H+-transporting ATPase subunit b